MKSARIGAALVGAALVATAAALGTSAAQAAGPSTSAAALRPTGTITVFAAASLTGVFSGPMKAAFEKRYPGTNVQYVFNGSPTLVTQIKNGAPVDVLATADETNMNNAIKNGSIAVSTRVPFNPLLFARNTMAIAMPANNHAGIVDGIRNALVSAAQVDHTHTVDTGDERMRLPEGSL